MRKRNLRSFLSLFLPLFFLFFPINAEGDIFEYKHVKDARYRIISVVDQSVFIDGVLSHSSQVLNRIAVSVTNARDGIGEHSAVYQTSERLIYDSQQKSQTPSSVFKWEREYDSVFERDKLGHITINHQYFMPMVRSIPVFPGRNLNKGDTWNVETVEVHDFRDSFGIEEPYRIPFRAFYQYVGERQWEDSEYYPAFFVNYNIEIRLPEVRGESYPTRMSATNSMIIYWDPENGVEKAYTGTSRITFQMSDGRTLRFDARSKAELVDAEEMNRETLASEIINEIGRLDIKDVNVNVVDEGISLSLEDIRFHPDSERMLPGEEAKLERIAEILKRYPGRDIVVSGHAALAGSPEYLMRLSQGRARTIADFLLSRNVRTADRIIIRGYGAERPVADNSTEEGMRKNRRVEITILEN